MACELLFLQQNYFFRKMYFWFAWPDLWKLSVKEFFFSKVSGNFSEKLTLSHVLFKDFYHKFAHKSYITVIFKNIFSQNTINDCWVFLQTKDKINVRNSK